MRLAPDARRASQLLPLAAACLLVGCVSDRGPAASPIRPENLFVSPSGEPFRAGLDEPYASARWFAGADSDHDGVLTRAEFQADALRAFRRYDANGDGVVDGLEIQAYEDKIVPEILPRIAALRNGEGMDQSLFGGRGRSQGGRSERRARVQAGDRQAQGAGLFGYLNEPEPLTAADADLDGRVTLKEWVARTDRRFDLLAEGGSVLKLEMLPKTLMQRVLDARRAGGRRGRSAPR